MGLYLIIGPILTIIGLGLLMNPGRMNKMMIEMMESKGMMFLMGMINIILGLVLVNFVDPDGWETLVLVIIGWGSLIKGILLNLFPKIVKKHALSSIKEHGSLLQGALFVFTLFGLWMSWVAYVG